MGDGGGPGIGRERIPSCSRPRSRGGAGGRTRPGLAPGRVDPGVRTRAATPRSSARVDTSLSHGPEAGEATRPPITGDGGGPEAPRTLGPTRQAGSGCPGVPPEYRPGKPAPPIPRPSHGEGRRRHGLPGGWGLLPSWPALAASGACGDPTNCFLGRGGWPILGRARLPSVVASVASIVPNKSALGPVIRRGAIVGGGAPRVPSAPRPPSLAGRWPRPPSLAGRRPAAPAFMLVLSCVGLVMRSHLHASALSWRIIFGRKCHMPLHFAAI